MGEDTPWNPRLEVKIKGSVNNGQSTTLLAEMFNVDVFIVSRFNPLWLLNLNFLIPYFLIPQFFVAQLIWNMYCMNMSQYLGAYLYKFVTPDERVSVLTIQ